MNQLTSLDIHYLLREFKQLISSKINNIYQPLKSVFYFQLHIPNKGKTYLKIILPSFIFLTEKKESVDKPLNFCLFLRKYINSTRIRDITQKNFERIIEFRLEKEKTYTLIIELFSKGNIVLCDEKYTIINQLEQQKWSQREIRKGLAYKYPKKKFNFLEIKEDELKMALKSTERDKLVTFLATELGLGGGYSEEICSLAKIDKDKKPVLLREEETRNLYSVFIKIKNRKPELNGFKTFSEAIEDYSSKEIKKPEEIMFQNQLIKLKSIILTQEKRIEELKREEQLCREKAELVYSNYQLIECILKDINRARERYSWDEIKERLKGHKIVKMVDAKEKRIVVELE